MLIEQLDRLVVAVRPLHTFVGTRPDLRELRAGRQRSGQETAFDASIDHHPCDGVVVLVAFALGPNVGVIAVLVLVAASESNRYLALAVVIRSTGILPVRIGMVRGV
jgi:hypothetical protein